MPRIAGLTTEAAKEKVLEFIAAGMTVERSMAAVGLKTKTFENWRSKDRDYAGRVDQARADRQRALEAGRDGDLYQLDFATWRKKFLGYETYEHQQQWIDVLEGRDPIPLSGCDWEPSNLNRLIINVPPGFSKSTTITVDYVTYKICMNPNVRIVIVSKRQEQARKFLHQIKQRLTSTMFTALQTAYAPPGGFRPQRGEGTYSANTIYVAGRNSDAKDPTVEVLGMGSQIYGTRADLIILDDCIVGANAHEFEKQVYWLETEVESRIKNGKILIVGTRLATRDLYAELRDGDRYLSGQTPWSYLRQPMVREFAEDPKDWVTLWPYSSTPYDEADTEPNENGLYTMFDGPTCAEIRGKKPPRVWSLVYQQQQVAEDATFHPTCVRAAINGQRKPGPLRAGAFGHPRNGREGMHIIGAIDPAGTGEAFILIYAVHRQTKERYVLNAFCANHTLPSWYAEQIETLTPEYGINEWVIEQNSYASWLIHDERITAYLRGSGVKLSPHFTGRNKQDPDFGVATMASLFGTMRRINDGAGRQVHNGDHIIHLPDPINEGVKALVEQLISWQPGKLGRQLRQDGPMALWFAETRARQVLGYGEGARQNHFVNNPYLARRDLAKRMVVPYADYRAQYA